MIDHAMKKEIELKWMIIESRFYETPRLTESL
jgi:hypothetical protein